MFLIDTRTVFLGYVTIHLVNMLLIAILYMQIKKRFQGTLFILLNFVLSAAGNVLIFLRDLIPDWISIILGNTLVVSAIIFLFIGLEQFVRKRGPQIQNYLMVFAFILVYSYFTIIKPDVNARKLVLAFVFVFAGVQIAWLMLKRAPAEMRKITISVGLVFCVVSLIQGFRFIYVLLHYKIETNYFDSNQAEAIFLLTYQILLIFFAYSIILMYNKRLIVEIKVQEEKFSKAFHGAPLIIMLTKFSDGQILDVNNSFVLITGHKPADVIGLNTLEIRFWKKEADRQLFLDELNSRGSVKELEVEFLKKSGKPFVGLVSSEIIHINNEKCILSAINDISLRKKTENQLRKSEAELRDLNATKDKFFSIIAHDLKSPFNGILGFSELLMEQIHGKDYSGIERYAEVINSSAHRAVNLLSNLMQWSMSQTGRMEFNPEYVDLVAQVKTVTTLLMPNAQQKSIHLKLDIPQNLIIRADKTMLDIVLRNLISNAIKFTPREGSVFVSVEKRQKDCLICVNDTGMGIDDSNLEKLFRIEGTFSSPGTDNEMGTGLGLILCKDFVEKHNGKIWVESELNVGSSFYFTLPLI